jgi:ribosome maturation factor RimP
MELKEKIIELVNKYLPDQDFFVVDIEVGGNAGMRKISILVDSDKGITIEECSKISRSVGHEIEEKNIIDSAYLLEVSSPGVDRPLKSKREYLKNKGRKLAVTLNDSKIIEGTLEEVKDDALIIAAGIKKPGTKKVEIKPLEIPFKEIKKSNVIVSFK